MKQIEYYGTRLDQAGHYLYILEGNQMNTNRRSFGNMPFNAEGLPYAGDKLAYKNGTVKWYNCFGFTICAIAGSCYDDRLGSKTIFFIEEDLTIAVFSKMLREIPIVQKIISQMKFPVLSTLLTQTPPDGIEGEKK